MSERKEMEKGATMTQEQCNLCGINPEIFMNEKKRTSFHISILKMSQ